MPFYSVEYRKKYVSDNIDKIQAIQKKYYYSHKEEESIRNKRKYLYSKECKRLRAILFCIV